MMRNLSRRSPRLSLLGLVVGVVESSGGLARADDKAACVQSSDQAQSLRDEGKYRAARTSLVDCARDACPALVRRDCEKWLNELDAAQPTVVFGARDPKGNDVAGTRVLMDGALLVDHLDGKPTAVDPGEHVFRYEAPGTTLVEQRVVVRVNEKNRVLTAVLMAQTAPASAPAPAAPSPPPEPAAGEAGSARAQGPRRELGAPRGRGGRRSGLRLLRSERAERHLEHARVRGMRAELRRVASRRGADEAQRRGRLARRGRRIAHRRGGSLLHPRRRAEGDDRALPAAGRRGAPGRSLGHRRGPLLK